MCSIVAYCTALMRGLKLRGYGKSTRGDREGTVNTTLAACMDDIHVVADLRDLQKSRATVEDQLSAVSAAIARLTAKKLIPPSTVVSANSVREAAVKLQADDADLTNKALLKLLYRHVGQAHPFIKVVVRLWLLSPESVVESMTSMLKEIFAMHR